VVGKVEGATGPYVVYLDHDEEDDDEGVPLSLSRTLLEGFPIAMSHGYDLDSRLIIKECWCCVGTGKIKTVFVADSFTSFLGLLRSEEEMEAEMEAAELVGEAAGEEQEEDSEGAEEEEEEGEEGAEEADGDDDQDADEAGHVTKKRRNEEGNEDVSAEAAHEAEDDDASSVGDKRKSSD
jgi:hypothetical protein